MMKILIRIGDPPSISQPFPGIEMAFQALMTLLALILTWAKSSRLAVVEAFELVTATVNATWALMPQVF
jgi:hypothetical protein